VQYVVVMLSQREERRGSQEAKRGEAKASSRGRLALRTPRNPTVGRRRFSGRLLSHLAGNGKKEAGDNSRKSASILGFERSSYASKARGGWLSSRSSAMAGHRVGKEKGNTTDILN